MPNAEFEKLLDDFNKAYETGSDDWFKYFHPDATVYTLGSTEPFVGLAAYQQNFQPLLKERRQVRDLKRDVQVMGDTAVAMQLQRIVQGQVVTTLRRSTIWKKDGGEWKIIHSHSALSTNPYLEDSVQDPSAIRVLTERIATVSAQTGVAQ